MIGGEQYGFPVEIVIIFFAIGIWIGKNTCILFDPQIEETIEFYKIKEYNRTKYVRIIIALIIDVIGLQIILIEPIYIHSILLIIIGVNILLTLPKKVMGVVIQFAIIFGIGGFLFENYLAGFLPELSIWKYDLTLYESLSIPDPVIGVAPISVFFAYTGIGLILFSSTFALNGFIKLKMYKASEKILVKEDKLKVKDELIAKKLLKIREQKLGKIDQLKLRVEEIVKNIQSLKKQVEQSTISYNNYRSQKVTFENELRSILKTINKLKKK